MGRGESAVSDARPIALDSRKVYNQGTKDMRIKRCFSAQRLNQPLVRLACTIAALFAVGGAPVLAQVNETAAAGSRVAVVEIEAPRDEARARALAVTLSRTTALVLELLGSYDVRRIPFLTPHHDLERAADYLTRERFDYAVYGVVNELDGRFAIKLFVWQRGRESVVLRREARADSVFDIFDVGDAVVLDLVRAFSGEDLAFGTLIVENRGAEGTYTVYVDGTRIGTDIDRERILSGTRRVEIRRPGRFGEDVIAEETITVPPNDSAVVVFSLPAPDIVEVPAAPREEHEAPMHGDLRLTVWPPDAEVFLNDEPVGTGTIDLRGLPAGRYAITSRHDAFITLNEIIGIEPSVRTDLERRLALDESSVLVRAHLRSSLTPMIASGIVTLTQMFYLGAANRQSESFFGGLTHADTQIASIRVGHLIAGETRTAVILSAATALGISAAKQRGGSLEVIGTITMVTAAAYDIFLSGFAADRVNRDTIDTMRRDGYPGAPLARETAGLHAIARIGGGASVGAEFRFLSGYLGAAALAGVGAGDQGLIGSPIAQFTVRGAAYPLARHIGATRPYGFFQTMFSTEFINVRLTPMVGIGLEHLIGAFIVSFEAPIVLSAARIGAMFPAIGVSWRIER